MTSEKRRRGRPWGTGKDDTPHLRRVADLLVANHEMTATSAMKQVLRTVKDDTSMQESRVRRLQVKWKREKDIHLSEAKIRMQARIDARPRHAPSTTERVSTAAAALSLLPNGSIAKMAKAFADYSPIPNDLAFSAFKKLREEEERMRKLVSPLGYRELMGQHQQLRDFLRGPLYEYSQIQEKLKELTRPFGI